MSVIFGDILFDELGFGAEFDTKIMPKFVDLMCTVVAIARIVAVLESEAVLGSFDEKED